MASTIFWHPTTRNTLTVLLSALVLVLVVVGLYTERSLFFSKADEPAGLGDPIGDPNGALPQEDPKVAVVAEYDAYKMDQVGKFGHVKVKVLQRYRTWNCNSWIPGQYANLAPNVDAPTVEVGDFIDDIRFKSLTYEGLPNQVIDITDPEIVNTVEKTDTKYYIKKGSTEKDTVYEVRAVNEVHGVRDDDSQDPAAYYTTEEIKVAPKETEEFTNSADRVICYKSSENQSLGDSPDGSQ